MVKSLKKLSPQDLRECLQCKLCDHYIVDPVTITECVHSFCRSCLLKHLKDSKTCPVCKVELGLKLSKAFRRDDHLRSMIYRMIPYMYWSEIKQRTDYMKNRMISEDEIAFLLDNDMTNLANHLCAPDEMVSLCVEYIRSAPTQDEADEDMELSKMDQPGTSGLSKGDKTVDRDGLTNPSRKDEEKDKMETDGSEAKQENKEGVKDADEKPELKKGKRKFEEITPSPEFKRYFNAPAKTTLRSLRKVMEGKLKVRENTVQLLFLDITKNTILEDTCTLQDVAYMFGWDRRESMRILFTLQREPMDEEPPILQMEQMPVLTAEEPMPGAHDEEMQDLANSITTPVVLPSLTVSLDAASMDGTGKPAPIIITGPPQPPRKRRKVSSPTKRTSKTPPYPVQRMTGLSPHEKAPPPQSPAQQPVREVVPGRRNLLNPAALNGSVLASGAALPPLAPIAPAKPVLKQDGKVASAGEKQENLNSRIQEILFHKGLPPPPQPLPAIPITTIASGLVCEPAEMPGPSRTTTCISTVPSFLTPNVTAAMPRGLPPVAASCIVPTSTTVAQLRAVSRSEKVNYEEFVRRMMTVPRFFAATGPNPLMVDPRYAHTPIKSILSIPQTDVAPYLRPPPPNPFPSIIHQLAMKRKHFRNTQRS